MKANKLMIGDWVQNPLGWKAQVQSIRYVNTIKDEWEWLVKIGINNETFQDHLSLNEIGAIPLTAEILEKNGFEICNEDTDGAIQYDYGSRALGIDIWINTKPCLLSAWRTWDSETKSYTMVEELPINCVHELQHALRLCGIEKEIEL